MAQRNITVIGCGNMGGALLRGWAKAIERGAADLALTATAHSMKRLDALREEFPAINVTTDNVAAVADADIIVLAVKPWLIADVVRQIQPAIAARRPMVISVAANITSADLATLVAADVPCVYAMPNIAAEYGESMTFVEECTEAETACELFRLVGEARIVPTRLMQAGMMMAGSGIAYVMRFLRAMMEGGVEMGFYPNDARDIAMQTMQGAVELLRQTGLHPEVAIDRVTTPGGITIRGLNELDHSGFNSAVILCLKAGLTK